MIVGVVLPDLGEAMAGYALIGPGAHEADLDMPIMAVPPSMSGWYGRDDV